jgi:hypothetical protein
MAIFLAEPIGSVFSYPLPQLIPKRCSHGKESAAAQTVNRILGVGRQRAKGKIRSLRRFFHLWLDRFFFPSPRQSVLLLHPFNLNGTERASGLSAGE